MSLTDNERKWLEEHFDDLRREMVQLQVVVAKLQVRAGFSGFIGGSIPVLITIGIYLVLKGR